MKFCQKTNAMCSASTVPCLSEPHQLCISHLLSGGCAQQETGSCPALIMRLVSAGHVNRHGDVACGEGAREASEKNLFIVCQLISSIFSEHQVITQKDTSYPSLPPISHYCVFCSPQIHPGYWPSVHTYYILHSVHIV